MVEREVPTYPKEFRAGVQEMVQEFGGTFVREVRKSFRRPLRRRWAREFWRQSLGAIDGGGDLKQAAQARKASVAQSTVSRGTDDGELSLDMLLAVLLERGLDWHQLPAPPKIIEVSAECYIEAMHYAQECYLRKSRTDGRADRPLHRREFEYLLRIFREPAWFGLMQPCNPGSECEALRRQRDAVAPGILARAKKRLDGFASDEQEGAASEIAADLCNPRVVLERVQSEWGAGFMLAIEVLPYRWEV